MKKFEAVSGDQSLFDSVGALDSQIFIVHNGAQGIYASAKNKLNHKVIAERKPIEKYVPKVGDDYISYGSEKRCIAIDRFGNVWGIDSDIDVNCDNTKVTEFTKIDRSPNPVNMVVSKEIPRVGERFKIDSEMDRIFKCSKISGGYVVTECGCEFAISLNEFNIVDEEKWVPKDGESFRVGGILYHDARVVFEGAIAGDTDVFGYYSTYSHHKSTKFERP